MEEVTRETPGIRIEEIVEEIPCGESVITKYWKVVRQDVEIRITKGPLAGSDAGRIT